MFLQIESFLTPGEVQAISQLASQAKFLDGKASNPHNVRKNNVIVDPADPAGQQAAQIASTAFQRNEEVRNFTLPLRIAPPQLLRYSQGMTYGAHVDAAFMAVGQQQLRSDISATVFISDPDSYQGGELTIYMGTELLRIKGQAGHAVFYPSTTLHQVSPVTAGERLVMITFIQSQIPEQLHRDLFYTLNEVRAIEGAKMDWRTRTHLEYVLANLQRLWSR